MKKKQFVTGEVIRLFKTKKPLRIVLMLFSLFILYAFLYKISMPRVNAFGCFDDCFAIVGGYFISHGKVLYSEIFYNHQLLMPHISALLQEIFQPGHMFELIQLHRQFVLFFGFVFSLLLALRFGWKLFFVLFIYELSKFYLFGNRFLPESLIVYPLLYLCSLVWLRLNKGSFIWPDYILTAIFTWFVVFIREPYAPLAVALFVLIISGRKVTKEKVFAVILFLILSLVTLASLPIGEYFFNIYSINKATVFASESRESNLFGLGMLQTIFYPVYIFFKGEWNHFRIFTIGVSFVFLASLLFFLKQRKFKVVCSLILILGLANLRPVPPGHLYFSAFHMNVWYSLFILFTVFLLWEVFLKNRKIGSALTVVLVSVFIYFSFSPHSYLLEKVSTHEEFITNFGKELQIGSVIQAISSPEDTLFLDGADDLIYWQAKLSPAYKYSWYTSFMPYFAKYRDARLTMFEKTPPDIYYGSCPKEKNLERIMPANVRSLYINIPTDGKPSCLFVKKTKLPSISKEQWHQAGDFRYYPPEDTNL